MEIEPFLEPQYLNIIIHMSNWSMSYGQDRVATAQGKQGIGKSIFPDRENTGNLLKNIKNMFLHREFTTNTGKILRVKKNNEFVI